MKRVMKKLNRALSIMLVAAMVLTMAPQTAMPVLAAGTGGNTDVSSDGTTVVGKTPSTLINTEDPASPTEELVTENNGSDEIQTASTNEQNSVQQSTESEPSPNAVEPVGSTAYIRVEHKEKVGDKESASGDVAEVIFTSGVDASENAVGGAPVEFYVEPKPGWQAPTVRVEVEKDGKNEDVSATLTGTRPVYILKPNGSDSRTFTGNITITLTGEKAANKLCTINSAPTMYLVGQANNKTNPAINSTGLTGLPFELFEKDKEITIAIACDASGIKNVPYAMLSAQVNSQTAKGIERNAGTSTIRPDGASADVKCVTFTFKPSDLTGYESEINKASVDWKLDVDGTTLTSATITVDATSEASPAKDVVWKVGQNTGISALDTKYAGFKHYQLNNSTMAGSLGVDDGASLTLKKDNYRETEGTGANSDKVWKNMLVFDVLSKDTNAISIEKVWVDLAVGTNKIKIGEIEAKKLDGDCYGVDLTEVDDSKFTDNLTITIKAKASYVSEEASGGFNVHDITFTGDLKNVEIKKDQNKANFDTDTKELGEKITHVDGTGHKFNFTLKPKDGYDVSKGTNYNSSGNSGDRVVKISYRKVFKIVSGGKTESIISTQDVGGEYKLKDIQNGSSNDVGIYTLDTVNSVAGLKVEETTSQNNSGGTALPTDVAGLAEKVSDSTFTSGLGSATYTWSLKNINIDIKTVLTKDQEGNVTIDCPKDMSYEVGGTDVEKDENSENRYRIGLDAEYVAVSVTSDVTPTISYGTEANLAKGTSYTPYTNIRKEGNTYTANIPVKLLHTETVDGETVIKAGIKIGRGKQNLKVMEILGAATPPGGAFTGDIKIEGAEKEPIEGVYTTIKGASGIAVEEGKDITVTLTAKPGTAFKEANYKLGTDPNATPTDISISGDQTTASFSLKVSEEITVTAKTVDAFKYKVTYGSSEKALPVENGVYAIPAGVKTVKIRAFSGTTPQGIETVKLFDGSGRAASTAAISLGTNSADADGDNDGNTYKNTVTLTLSDKDGDTIRLELKGRNKNTGRLIDLPGITIRRDKAAEEITITDEDGNKAESVSIIPGEEKTYKVSVTGGGLNFMKENVDLEIAESESRIGGGTVKDNGDERVAENKNIVATYNHKKGTLKVKGNEVKEGNTAPVIVRFYDMKKRSEGKDLNNKLGVIAGGYISVKLDGHAITGIQPEVSAFNTTRNLQLALSTPGFSEGTAKNGQGIWYRITLRESVSLPNKDKNNKDYAGIKENVRGVAVMSDDGAAGKVEKSGREIYIKKTGESQEILLPVNYEYKDVSRTELKPAEVKTYNISVELVHHKDGANTEAVWTKTDELVASKKKDLTTKTAKATYQETLSLSASSATVYANREGFQEIATAGFGAEGGVCQLMRPVFVNTVTGVEISDTEVGMSARADLDGSVYVNARNVTKAAKARKDLGLKVSAYAEGANEASGVIALTLVDGVNRIDFKNGRSRTLYKQDGKAATMKLEAVLNEGGAKPKKTTISYTLADRGGVELSESACTLSQNLVSSVKVNAKNGTVTVGKNYVHDSKDCTFSVVAKATGVEGVRGVVTVTVSQTAQEMGGIVIVDGAGNVVAKNDGATLRNEDFRKKDLYVRALRSDAVLTKTKYEVADDYSGSYLPGVSVASSAGKSLAVSAATGKLTMLGSSKKPVKLTVTSADGSKKTSKSITVNLAGPSKLGLNVYDENAVNEDGLLCEAGAKTAYKYSGPVQRRLAVYPLVGLDGGKSWVNVDESYSKNIKIDIKGGKKEDVKDAPFFYVLKTAPITTITVSDKTDKNVAPVTYTVEQSPATDLKGKKLSVKAPKITEAMLESAKNEANADDRKVELKFEITGKDKASYAGMHILLTPDYTKTKLVDKMEGTEEHRRATQYFLDSNTRQRTAVVGTDGSFTIDLDVDGITLIPGTYTLIASVGKIQKNGDFAPMSGVKTASVGVKIPGKAIKKVSLQEEANFTLSASGKGVGLTEGISSPFSWEIVERSEGDKKILVRNAVGADGKINRFTDFFNITKENGEYTLSMNKNIKASDLTALTGDKTGKDLTGYVTIRSMGAAGRILESKDVRINVTLSKENVLRAEANGAYRGSEATVRIYSAGSKGASSVYGVSAATGVTAKVSDKAVGGVKDIKVTVPKTAGDEYTVDLKVLTAGSGYATADYTGTTESGDGKESVRAGKYGDSVKVTIKVSDPSTASNVLKVATEEGDMAFQALHTSEEYKNQKESDDWNSYFENGKYVLRVDMGSEIDGAKIKYVSYDKTFKDGKVTGMVKVDKGEGTNQILLTLDQAAFLSRCAEGGAISKGASIELPLTATMEPSGMKDESVKLTVKLPSPATYGEAEAKMLAAESTLLGVKAPEEKEDTEDTTAKSYIKKINAEYRKAMPLDADVNVTEKFDPQVDSKGDKIKATLKFKSRTGSGSYEKAFEWAAPAKTQWTAKGLQDEIKNLLGLGKEGVADVGNTMRNLINGLAHNKENQVDNDYTADRFMTDLSEILKTKGIGLGDNLSISLAKATRKRASEGMTGMFSFTIKVYDGVRKEYSDGLEIKVFIPKLINLGDEGAAVETALNNQVDEKLVYDALGKSTDITDLHNQLAIEIERIAEEALTNKNIVVSLDEISAIQQSDNGNKNEHLYSSTPSSNWKGCVSFRLPDGGTDDGGLRYKLRLKLTGYQDFVIDRTGNTARVSASSNATGYVKLNKGAVKGTERTFQTINEAKTKVGGATAGTDMGNVLTWNSSRSVAEFKDQIEKGDGSTVESAVKKIVEGFVTGMYLDVNVAFGKFDDDTTPTTASGKVTITDTRKRVAKTSTASYKEEFDFEIPILGSLASGWTESKLGDVSVMPEDAYNSISWVKDPGKNGPTYDRVSGLNFGQKKLVKRTQTGEVEYRYDVTGTLKRVEGWTGAGLGDGYMAAVRIPIPKELQNIATKDSNKNAATVFVQNVGHMVKPWTGSQVNKDYMDLVMKIDATGTVVDFNTAHSTSSTSTHGSGVRGFKLVVDWGGLPASGEMTTSHQSGTALDSNGTAVTGDKYTLTTYTFDMSRVKLDDSSPAIVKMVKLPYTTWSEVRTALKDDIGIDETNEGLLNVEGNTEGKIESVIVGKGDVTRAKLKGFKTGGHHYFVAVSVESPGNVVPEKSVGTAADTVGESLTAYARVWNMKENKAGDGTPESFKATKDGKGVWGFTRGTMIVCVNHDDLSTGPMEKAIEVDWDGAGTDWASTRYVLDLSNVVYKKAASK